VQASIRNNLDINGGPEELEAEDSSEFQELNRSQVLHEKICGIVVTFNEVDFRELSTDYFAYVMIADVDMLRAFLSDGIRGDKDRALVVTTDWDWFEVVVKLPQKGMHPDHLAATIRERHVLSFSGR